MKDSDIGKVAKEVKTILDYMPIEEKNKISKKMISFLEENMDKNYNFKLDPDIDLNSQNLLPESKTLLVAIYRDYLASSEEKAEITKELFENEEKYNKKLSARYNMDTIWEERKKIYHNTENIQMVEYKETFLKKIINKIKNIFDKKTNIEPGDRIELNTGKKYLILARQRINRTDYYFIADTENLNEKLIIENNEETGFVKAVKDYKIVKKVVEMSIKLQAKKIKRDMRDVL